MKTHAFNTNIAKEVGIECAVLLYNIEFWINKNRANNKHFYEGRYWTYNTTKAFAELFPYMSEKVIYNSLKKLIDKGYLLKGNFNQNTFDRTCWYALADKGEIDIPKEENPFSQTGNSISQNGKMEIPTRENDSNVSDKNTDKKLTDINTDSLPLLFPQGESESVCTPKPKKNDYTEDFDKFWILYPRKINKKLAYKAWNACLKKKVAVDLLLNKAKEYADYIQAVKSETQYIKHPQFWLSGACYENDYASLLCEARPNLFRGGKNYSNNDDDENFSW